MNIRLLAAILGVAATAAHAQPLIGEIRWVAFNFAPAGWASCNGQLLPIAEYDALFSLIGTIYGGDGQETFALPDLQSRAPVHQGQGPGLSLRYIGEMGGLESSTLTIQQMPAHGHTAYGRAGLSTDASPPGRSLGRLSTQTGPASFEDSNLRGYRLAGTLRPMAAGVIGPAGGSQPHENMQPYLGMHCIMSLYGIYPSRN